MSYPIKALHVFLCWCISFPMECMLHVTPRWWLKVEYVDSIYCNKNLFISSLSTCTYEWSSCTYDCTCERVEELYTCMIVCVYEQWNFDGFIVLEHAWVIDLCWSISLFNMHNVNLRVLIIYTCLSVIFCWLCVACMSSQIRRVDFVSKDGKEMLTKCFMRCEILFVLGKKSPNCYTCLCLTSESVFWRSMFFSICVWLMKFWHQDVRVHGDVHKMWNLVLWRSKRICCQVVSCMCVCDKMSKKVCSHCRPCYVLTPRREGDGKCILPDVEFGTVEVK